MVREDNVIGSQVGNYLVIKEIASGAFGRVYLAQHLVLKSKPVAIKLLHTSLFSKQDQDSFIREAQFLDILRHPHILPIIDVSIHGDLAYLVAEYASHGSLRDRLRHQHNHPLPIDEAVRIIVQVGQALQYAHQRNIVHRDLKPENILFNAKDEVLLADFGISTMLEAAKTTHVDFQGTLAYMAPEQFAGLVSVKSDQYALGCIAYELFTGHQPFSVQHPGPSPIDRILAWGNKHKNEIPLPPTQYNPAIPEYIEKAVLIAMEKDRTNRHEDISTFISRLSKTKEQWLEEADGHYHARRYTQALTAYEYVIQLDPKFAPAYNSKGKILRRLKRDEEAMAAYEQAIRLEPSNPDFHNNKGNTLRGLKRDEEALISYELATRLAPQNTIFQINRGKVLRDLKHYEEALHAYEEAIRLKPADANLHNQKGNVLRDLKRYEEALVAYNKAIELNPADAGFHNNIGLALSSLKRYEQSILAYDRAIKLSPDNAISYNNKGLDLLQLKRDEEALAEFNPAISLEPANATFHTNRGLALRRLKRYQEALSAFEQAILLDKNNQSALRGKEDMLKKLAAFETTEQAEG